MREIMILENFWSGLTESKKLQLKMAAAFLYFNSSRKMHYSRNKDCIKIVIAIK